MAGLHNKAPLATILSVPARRPGQLSIKLEVIEIKPITYHGMGANLPDNIYKRAAAQLFCDMSQLPLYSLKAKLADQFLPTANFPGGLIIEEIRPVLLDVIISVEGNVAGVRWLGDPTTQAALAEAFEHLFVTEAYLAALLVANVKLRVVIDSDDIETVEREYNTGVGFIEQPTIGDLQLWTKIELFHVQKVRHHLNWARETESWLESSLGSFLMTCKQLLPNGEPLTDAAKLERKASTSSRASVDKMGMTSFANAFRKIVLISAEIAAEVPDKIDHTHRFEKNFPGLYQERCRLVELIVSLKNKFQSIMDVGITGPGHEIYEPWRSKVLAKEADLYLPLVSVIPIFKEHLLDIDVHMDEYKSQLTSAFPSECRVLIEVSENASQLNAINDKPLKPSSKLT